jgi:LacI family transcriptional regulator
MIRSDIEVKMARAKINDVARAAGMSVSTVNRVLHEPDKVREETIKAVLDAAEAVGFYGVASIKGSLRTSRPKIRIGMLLLPTKRTFYKDLATVFEIAAKAVTGHQVILRLEHYDDLSAQSVVDGIMRLAASSDVLAIIAPEHPLVSATLEQLAERGIKSFAIITQLTARCGVGYVGLDMWKVGRMAGWAFDNICKRPGKIATLIGNHRYRCQETNESGFRSYFREHSSGFELLEARLTFESSSISHEVTEELLQQHPDIVGLYVSGGGLSGAIAALRESGRGKDIVSVGYELTDYTRAALIDGTLNFLITHPLQTVANEAIAAMIRAFDGGADFQPQAINLPFEIYTSENL